MSERESLFDRAFNRLTSAFDDMADRQSSARLLEEVHPNGVTNAELKRLRVGAFAVNRLVATLASDCRLDVSRDPYNSVSAVFVNRTDFKDVLTEWSNVADGYVGFIVRSKTLAGKAIKFTSAAGVLHSVHLGSYDSDAEMPIAFSDRLSFDAGQPYVFHENEDDRFLIPNRDVLKTAQDSMAALPSVPASALCGINTSNQLVDFFAHNLR